MSDVQLAGPLLCRFLFSAYSREAMHDRGNSPENRATSLVTIDYPVARPISAPDEQSSHRWFAWELESGKFARHQPPPPPKSRKPKKERVKKVAARKKRRGW